MATRVKVAKALSITIRGQLSHHGPGYRNPKRKAQSGGADDGLERDHPQCQYDDDANPCQRGADEREEEKEQAGHGGILNGIEGASNAALLRRFRAVVLDPCQASQALAFRRCDAAGAGIWPAPNSDRAAEHVR